MFPNQKENVETIMFDALKLKMVETITLFKLNRKCRNNSGLRIKAENSRKNKHVKIKAETVRTIMFDALKLKM